LSRTRFSLYRPWLKANGLSWLCARLANHRDIPARLQQRPLYLLGRIDEHTLQDHATSPSLHPASAGLLCAQRCWLLHAVSSAWRFAMQFIGVSQLDHAHGAVKNMLSIF